MAMARRPPPPAVDDVGQGHRGLGNQASRTPHADATGALGDERRCRPVANAKSTGSSRSSATTSATSSTPSAGRQRDRRVSKPTRLETAERGLITLNTLRGSERALSSRLPPLSIYDEILSACCPVGQEGNGAEHENPAAVGGSRKTRSEVRRPRRRRRRSRYRNVASSSRTRRPADPAHTLGSSDPLEARRNVGSDPTPADRRRRPQRPGTRPRAGDAARTKSMISHFSAFVLS